MEDFKIHLRKYFLTLFFIFIPSFTLYPAKNIIQNRISLKIKNIRNKTINEIKILRLKRDNAPPIIISHAFMLTNLAMKNLGDFLWNEGFDVWMPNMRGHGNGEDKSIPKKIPPNEKRFFDFDHIISEDWPYLLNHIYNQTQKKVHILGFSIGGMTWEKVLSGVASNKTGKMIHNIERAKSMTKTVASFVELGTPMNLKSINPKIPKLMSPFSQIFNKLNCAIPLTTSESSKENLNFCSIEQVRRYIFNISTPHLDKILPCGIINKENIEESYEEFKNLTTKQLSSPHTDILMNMFKWMKGNYKSHDGQLNYAIIRTIYVPTLIILGSKDELAVPKSSYEGAKFFPKELVEAGKVQYVELDNFAHIDLIFKKSIKIIGPIIASFFNINTKS